MPRKQIVDPACILSINEIVKDPEKLRQFNRAELRAHWHTHFPKEKLPPTPGLLLHELAFKAQASVQGGLDRETKKLIRQLIKSSDKEKNGNTSIKLHHSTESKLRNGTKLIRRWKGIEHEVVYKDKQYHFQGETYRSLTKIAEIITGTHWSGPRFFGVNKLKGIA